MNEISLSPGQLVGGDFEIVRLLGAGGMGAVYVARQLSTGSIRALKVMRSRFARDPAFVRRFTLEARASAQVRSRHVVEVVQAGVDAALSLPWLALEYLEGMNLDEAMEAFGAPGAEDAELLLGQLWHAMGAAHDARLIHRDLKPENLFLAHGDSPGVPFTLKVLDFGIAKWLAEGEGATTERLVTPLWGAPEQSVTGARVGAYTDVWSLGLVVFWLYTGKPFFPTDRGIWALEQAIHHDPIPRASERAAELGCERSLGPAFDAWFARAVARDPAARFGHARDAGKALHGLGLAWATGTRAWRADGGTASTNPTEAAPHTVLAPIEPPRPETRAPEPNASTAAPILASPRSATHGATRTAARLALPVALVALGGAGVFAARSLQPVPSPARSSAATPAPPPPAAQRPVVIPPDMRLIPAATFPPGRQAIGSGGTTDKPIALAAFAIDRTEVDVRHYEACVAAGACTESTFHADRFAASAGGFAELCNARHPERAEHPINCVDRQQARAYCRWVGRRLPTEAEWEYAARGTEPRLYPWGDTPPASCDVAVLSGLCSRQPVATRPVGTRLASSLGPFGLADMSGNVWEWVEDDWSQTRAEATGNDPVVRNGSGVGVMRGGGWDYPADRATVVARLDVPSSRADVSAGFRCALSAEGP